MPYCSPTMSASVSTQVPMDHVATNSSTRKRSVDDMVRRKSSTAFCIDRMGDILKTGSDDQRTVILFELHQLLAHYFYETVQVLVPIVCQLAPKWTIDLQVSAAEALLHVVQKHIPGDISKLICDTAFDMITHTRTAQMLEAWGEILVVVLPNVSWGGSSDISTRIAVLDEFTASTDEVCRKLVARVLGSLSSCLSKAEVETYVMVRALQLVDDLDVDVRGMVSESLAFIGQVVDIEMVENAIWPKLLSLLDDSDARIHAATLKTIAHIATVHKHYSETSKLYSELLPPIFTAECKFAKNAAEKDQRIVDDDTYLLLEIISQVFGPFVHAAHPYLNNSLEKNLAFSAFLAMATCNGPVVRRYCAFNFPGIAKSFANEFRTELAAIAEFLSRDADPETRWNLAAGIHETSCILMGDSSADNLFRTVGCLLQDSNELVRTNALEHLFELISALTEGETIVEKSDEKITAVFQKLDMFSRGNWRTQELLAKQLEKVCKMLPLGCVKNIVLPLLYKMAEDSTYMVRKAAMAGIAKGIWCLSFSDDRERIMNEFGCAWARGGVYWMRAAFVECAERACDVYSSNLFVSLFLERLVELSEDRVLNVRLRLARAVPKLTRLCFEDERFQKVVEQLQNDTDADVRDVMKSATEKIAREMSNRGQIQAEDERRVAEENKLREKMQAGKAEGRRRGGRPKMRGSTLKLGKAGGKTSSAHKHGNSASFENEQGAAEAPGSPVSVIEGGEQEGKQEMKGLSRHGVRKVRSAEGSASQAGGQDAVHSPRRKSLRVALGRVADETTNLASPSKRGLRKMLSGGREDESGGRSRKGLKHLLTHMGSGFKLRQQNSQVQANNA